MSSILATSTASGVKESATNVPTTTDNPLISLVIGNENGDTSKNNDAEESGHRHYSADSSTGKPRRKLVFTDGVAIIAGIIIGSGIFSSPGLALQRAGSPGLVLLTWSIAGVLVMMASFCYAELGSIIPSSGGDYDYLKRAYGDQVAFSFAWFNFFVGKTGSQAIIATVFGRYFDAVLSGDTNSIRDGTESGEEKALAKVCGVCLILFICALNCAGVKEGAVLSVVLTSTKVLLIVLVLIFAIVYVSSGNPYNEAVRENLAADNSFNGSNGIAGVGSAMIACLWAFDGFADVGFLMEELVDPIRDLPRIIRTALLVVTACYISVNVAYLCVLKKEDMEDTDAIAVDFGSTVSDLWSRGGSVLPIILALGVSLSTVGSINGSVLTGGRAFMAVARHGQAPAVGARLNRFGAPYVTLIAQCAWSLVLILLPGSSFSSLLDYMGPCSWAFYAATASSLIVIRYREPELHRPFSVPLYPLPPLIVIFMALGIVVSAFSRNPLWTLLAFGFALVSVPVYYMAIKYGGMVARSSSRSSRSSSSSSS